MKTMLSKTLLAFVCIAGLFSSNSANAQEMSAISLNSEISVVPAPGAVTIDGKTDDWDLSAGVWSYNDPTLVERYSVWTHLMHDAKGIYFLARYSDKTPLQNATRGKDFNLSWRADAYQARVILDDATPNEHQMHINLFYSTPEQKPYMLVKHGGFKDKPPYDETGPDRPELNERYDSTMEKFGGQIAFAPTTDGKGYNCEAFWPWSYLRVNGQPLNVGDFFTYGIEAMWGNADGSTYVHRLADGIKDASVNRIFMFRARKGWGRAVLVGQGNLNITRDQQALQAQRLKSFVDYDTYGSIPIRYELSEDRDVTVAIDNAQGVRVRNLFGQFPRKKGPNTELWDGLDDKGKPVPPGLYTAAIVDHKPIELKLLNSVYNSSTTPWSTETGLKVWGSNHGHPTTAASRGDVLLVGFTGTEGTTGLLRADADGTILWTSHLEILDVTIGDKFAYTLSRESWQKKTILRRFTLDKGTLIPFEDAARTTDAVLPTTGDIDDVPDTCSLALSGGKLFAFVPGQKLFRIDPQTGIVEAQLDAPNLLAVNDRDETLYGLFTGGEVALMDAEGRPKTRLFTATGLQKPQRLAVSHDKTRFAISDGGTNQVFVLDGRGNKIQTLGAAYVAVEGMRPAGKFIETNFINPLGLDFDNQNRLWVAEAAKTSKRVTSWNAGGELQKQFWGSADYGAMAGFPITFDSTRYIAHGIEFQLDPNAQVGKKPTQEKPLIFHPTLGEARGFVYRVQNREYAVDLPGYNGGPRTFFIAKRDGSGAFVPCVRVTYANSRVKGSQASAWIDRNDNGREDEGEITSDVKGAPHYWSGGWMRPDLTILTADQWLYPLQGFTPAGVPLYDFANPKRPANIIANDAASQGSTGTAILDAKGNVSNGIAYATADGKRGVYPNPYGRHNAPAARRGLLIAPFRTNGVIDDVPGVGSVTALGGDRGEWFLLSMDGLYLSNLFQDIKGEVSLDENYIGAESFGGFFWRDEKGRALLQAGGPSYRIHEVLGLESTRKNTVPLQVSAAQIDEGARIALTRQGAGQKEPAELKIARLATLPTAPVEPDGSGPLIAGTSDFAVREEGDPTKRFRAALAHDGTALAIQFVVNDSSPWKNAEGRYTHAFIGGDSVDLQLEVPGRGPIRLLAAPVGGKNTLTYWQRNGTPQDNPTAYIVANNIANMQKFDIVRRSPGAKVSHKIGNTGYSVLITVPLGELGLDPAQTSEIKGVAGVIFSDPSGTNRASRLYWHDKATGLVSDVPSESRLNPAAWGKIVVEK